MLSGRLLSYLKKRKFSRNGHSLSLVFIRCHSLYHSLPLAVISYHPLYHSLSGVVTCCHSLSFVATCCTTRCHSLSTRCTTRLSFYKRSIQQPFSYLRCFCIKLLVRCLTVQNTYLEKKLLRFYNFFILKKKIFKSISPAKYLYTATYIQMNLYSCKRRW